MVFGGAGRLFRWYGDLHRISRHCPCAGFSHMVGPDLWLKRLWSLERRHVVHRATRQSYTDISLGNQHQHQHARLHLECGCPAPPGTTCMSMTAREIRSPPGIRSSRQVVPVARRGTCTASPGTILAPGSGIWWVQTYGSNGYGPWSDGMSFTVPPGKAALISPKETISGSTPPYSWHAVPGSTSYYLYVNDSTGNKISKWYSKEQAGCPGGTGTDLHRISRHCPCAGFRHMVGPDLWPKTATAHGATAWHSLSVQLRD